MMKPLTRRTFLYTTAACSASAMLGAAAKSPRADFPTEKRARIAVATYPFRASMTAAGNDDRDASKPGMDLAEFAKYIRTEFKVGGIEPLHSHFTSTEPGEILKLKAAFDAVGVRTANIPVDARVDLCSDDETKRKDSNAVYRHWIDIAVMLGSPSIRVWIPKCADTADIPKAIRALQPALDYAASRNIVVNLENDDPVYHSDTRVLAAIKQADTPYLRALPDFGNALVAGDERFNAQAVKRMFAQAWNISHVKDAEDVKGVHKTVALPALFEIAKAAGFRGYYSMESDSKLDPFVDTRHLIEQTLALM